ncbi:hypothetical protein F4808DRAFT_227274 [Astrocystis sublimbata]|nr:hypothetical protein F4808DRAFT_227274 [Astrocystis sublimbata]
MCVIQPELCDRHISHAVRRADWSSQICAAGLACTLACLSLGQSVLAYGLKGQLLPVRPGANAFRSRLSLDVAADRLRKYARHQASTAYDQVGARPFGRPPPEGWTAMALPSLTKTVQSGTKYVRILRPTKHPRLWSERAGLGLDPRGWPSWPSWLSSHGPSEIRRCNLATWIGAPGRLYLPVV